VPSPGYVRGVATTLSVVEEIELVVVAVTLAQEPAVRSPPPTDAVVVEIVG